MKKLAINIFLFLCITLPPLYLLDAAINKGLRDCAYVDGCMNEIYHSKASADVLICGSSQAKYEYSPAIIDSILHVNSYNIGIKGWPFHMQRAIFDIYLQHNKQPKYIIQNIDPTLFTKKEEFYDYEQFIPYANDEIVKKATQGFKGKFTFMEKHFPLFIYNNHFVYIVKGLKSYFKIGAKEPAKTKKGYAPFRQSWDGTFVRFQEANKNGITFTYDSTILKEYLDFLDFCKAKDIKVIMAYSPVYYEETNMVKNQKEMYDLFNSISLKYNIPILNYITDSLSADKRYFRDSRHLNVEGSELFTIKLATALKQYIHI